MSTVKVYFGGAAVQRIRLPVRCARRSLSIAEKLVALVPARVNMDTSGTKLPICGSRPLPPTNAVVPAAESATRAVLQVQNPNSPTPSVILKNLNPLPPDQ